MVIFNKGVEGKIARAIIKKKIQLIAMFAIGAVAGSVWLYDVQEVKVLFAERDKAEMIFENHFIEKAKAEEKKAETVEDIIVRVAKENNFEDTKTLLAIAKCESNFDRYAKNSVSSAEGLFQFLDGSWEYYNKKYFGSSNFGRYDERGNKFAKSFKRN